MEIIDYVCELLKITKEEAMNNSKMIEENLTYYWNSNRGGASVIVDNDGNYLAAVSSVNLERLLEEYKKGERNKNFFQNKQ
jgi:hypothetical protein